MVFNKTTIILFLLALSLAGNAFLFCKISKLQDDSESYNNDFPLLGLSKNLVVDSDQGSSSLAGGVLHYKTLRPKIEAKISSLDAAEQGNVSIYLQDIQKGAWMGINEKVSFVPASLLKVPIAMAILKKVENNELSLSQEIIVKDENIDLSSEVTDRFQAGQEKTVLELLKMMLKISDNTSKNVLKDLLEPEEINSVFTHIGIDNPYLADNEENLATSRQFSRVFKALYFSTYLKPQNSEMILEFLTETREEGLIAAGLPYEVQVAHKYGERGDILHDCGIIYDINNPYLLCVMTKKIEPAKARDLIQGISEEIYTYVSNK